MGVYCLIASSVVVTCRIQVTSGVENSVDPGSTLFPKQDISGVSMVIIGYS